MSNHKEIIVRVRNLVLDGQQEGSEFRIQRICGYLNARDFSKLMGAAESTVNPRTAKVNPVVKQIFETLANYPELFWIKSRGVLVATKQCVHLERERVKITLGDENYEGIMDGGHNTLAVAAFLLKELFDVKVTKWKEAKEYWLEHQKEIDQAIDEEMGREDSCANFLVPIEIIAPLNEGLKGVTSEQAEDSEQYFMNFLPDICAARNTNAQLNETAKGNQTGLYDELKKCVPERTRVVWKTGDGEGVKCDDVVALTCLPLMYLADHGALGLKNTPKLSTVCVYSQKSKCVDYYKKIVTSPEVSVHERGKYVITSKAVLSALKLVKDIIQFYDWLYLTFPSIYNGVEGCSFGRISAVNTTKESPLHFNTIDKKSDKTYPDGFIYPLLCGITALMQYDPAKQVLSWKKELATLTKEDFTKDNDQCTYVRMIKILNFDPQKVGKEKAVYDVATDLYKKMLAR